MKRLFFSLLISILLPALTQAQGTYKQLSAHKCDSLIRANTNNPDFIILDVRTYEEWIGDHLENGINRSTRDSDFNEKLNQLPRHKTYLIHCKSGGRSASAFSKMQSLKFSEVYEMIGGINAWKSGGYATTNVVAPELMLVDHPDSLFVESDSVQITVTNRGNAALSLVDLELNDIHAMVSNFEAQKVLSEAEDYTFTVYHSDNTHAHEPLAGLVVGNQDSLDFTLQFTTTTTLKENLLSKAFVLYPNPARDFIRVNKQGIHLLEIYSVNGKLKQIVHRPEAHSPVDISGLESGLYLVQARGKGEIWREKLVVL